MTAKEKMTAPIASVGADVEQPSSNKLTNQSIADLPGKGNLQATNNVENTVKSANKKNPDDLETVSMMELYDTAYPPKLPIVDGLLYNGTYLFVGSPKIGKTFFMAQIGYHISKGLPLWGFSVRQGTVLYLALEDDYARLQKRLSQMFGMEGSENFYFATKSKSLNDGLERQLVTFVTEHKDARLIIIDTLQKVREVGGDKFSYASDYEIVTKLKAFSDKYEYKCTHTDCNASTIAENFNGFLNYYSRMTERCADFICSLALETSCEGCSRICKVLGIKISGDTVIRLLLKRYQAMEHDFTGDKIGIDDFAYKKRHTYGTIIVDEETHNPITLLDGRDGDALRKWLKNNKHIKVITRDRASAYAKVIAEELPDAMQVADRFHLHQNLLEAIKKALNHELPATIKIPHNEEPEESRETDKKNCTGCG